VPAYRRYGNSKAAHPPQQPKARNSGLLFPESVKHAGAMLLVLFVTRFAALYPVQSGGSRRQAMVIGFWVPALYMPGSKTA